MTKFSEFKNQEIKKPQKEASNKLNETDISSLIDKYSRLSKDELMDEFLKASKTKREEGGLKNDEIDRIHNVLNPYLNNEQKDMLNDLLEMGKNDQ